jgi:hypothetical protein
MARIPVSTLMVLGLVLYGGTAARGQVLCQHADGGAHGGFLAHTATQTAGEPIPAGTVVTSVSWSGLLACGTSHSYRIQIVESFDFGSFNLLSDVTVSGAQINPHPTGELALAGNELAGTSGPYPVYEYRWNPEVPISLPNHANGSFLVSIQPQSGCLYWLTSGDGDGLAHLFISGNGIWLPFNFSGDLAVCVNDPPGPWEFLGAPLWGGAGPPVFTVSGAPSDGSLVTYSLASARPDATAYLVMGLTAAQAAFKGGTMIPTPTLVFRFDTDAQGEASVDTTWKPGVFLPGESAYFQWWIEDPDASDGFAASNGLRSTAS